MFKARFNKQNYYDPKGKFNNYDPGTMNRGRFNNADGNGGSMPGQHIKTAAPGNKMQINITMNNPTASNLTFEIWSFLNSCTRTLKTEYVNGDYAYIPQTSYEGIRAIAAGTDGTVGFNSVGNLIIRGAGPTPGPADTVATLSCKEIAYAALFEASGITPFEIAEFRYKSSNDAQKDEAIVYFQKTFSGGQSENNIVPRAYEKPTDMKENLINVDVAMSIGADKGVKTLVLAGQYVTLSLFIVGWTMQTLSE
jgi:hypothetical protein